MADAELRVLKPIARLCSGSQDDRMPSLTGMMIRHRTWWHRLRGVREVHDHTISALPEPPTHSWWPLSPSQIAPFSARAELFSSATLLPTLPCSSSYFPLEGLDGGVGGRSVIPSDPGFPPEDEASFISVKFLRDEKKFSDTVRDCRYRPFTSMGEQPTDYPRIDRSLCFGYSTVPTVGTRQ